MSAMPKPEPLPKMSEEEFLTFEAASDVRHEFLNGEVIAMAGGSSMHSLVKNSVNRLLQNGLRDRPCRVHDSDMLIKVRATGLKTYPDASVVCARPKFQDLRELELLNPKLIVEVLSDTTAAYDRGKKFWHYRQLESLAEYVLISTEEALVEVYLRQPDGTWSLRTHDGLDAVARLESLGVELPLREVYAKTALAEDEAQMEFEAE